MLFGVFGLLALVVLVLFWFDKEFTLRGKLIATLIYLALVGLSFLVPLVGGIGVAVFGLALYFVMFPSGGFGNH